MAERIISKAAEMDSDAAQNLNDNEFDLDTITPDADEWTNEKKLF